MSNNLYQRPFLRLHDFTGKELRYLLDLAQVQKAGRLSGKVSAVPPNLPVALVTERRNAKRIKTECGVVASTLGMNLTCIDYGAEGAEDFAPLKDTAREMGRMFRGIAYCGASHDHLTTLARFAGVPVWNAGTPEQDPLFVLAALMTMHDHCDKPLRKVSVAYLGDGRQAAAQSWMEAAVRLGMDLRIAAPASMMPDAKQTEALLHATKDGHGHITVGDTVADAVNGADFICAGDWLLPGRELQEQQERINTLKPYRVTMEVLDMAHNPKVRLLKKLPALHNRKTTAGELLYRLTGLDGLEVTDDVFESPASVVFDLSENYLHVFAAIFRASLTEEK